jgi:predicted Co/Zn/Cd cation transporter (cation efflux family)
MKTFLRLISIVPAAIAAFLVYAVIAAATSDGGARVGICVLYVAISIALSALVAWMWRSKGKGDAVVAAPPVA